MNVLIIGLGPHGNRLVEAVSGIPALNLVAVVDLKQPVLNQLTVDGSVMKSTDLLQVLSEFTIDIACITTTAPSHAGISITCMQHGVKLIMVEKPMACSLFEAQSIIDMANQTGTKLVVDHPRRYSKNYVYIKELISSKKLGDFRSIYIQRPGIGLGCLATHSFDLANFLTGLNPIAITGWVDEVRRTNPRGDDFEDPGGTIVMNYNSGAKAIICQIEDGAGPMTIEINLTKARIRVDEKMDILEIIERDPAVKKAPNQPAAYKKSLNPKGIGGKRNLVEDIKFLLQDLIQNEEPVANMDCGFDSIEILMAGYISDEQGNIPIQLPLSNEYFKKWLPIT